MLFEYLLKTSAVGLIDITSSVREFVVKSSVITGISS
jgi:thiamine phosphate synthase YjbQ (UPF0047 family)